MAQTLLKSITIWKTYCKKFIATFLWTMVFIL